MSGMNLGRANDGNYYKEIIRQDIKITLDLVQVSGL